MKRAISAVLVVILCLGVLSLAASAQNGPSNLTQAVAAACANDAALAGEKAQLDSGNGSVHSDYVVKVNRKALAVVTAVISYDSASEAQQYAVWQRDRLAAKLKSAQDDYKTGKATAKQVADLQKQTAQNEFDLSSAQVSMDNAAKTYSGLTGGVLNSGFDFAGAYLILDAASIPSSLPASDSTVTAKDANTLRDSAVKAFKTLGAALDNYVKSADDMDKAQADFKTGKIDKTALDTATANNKQARQQVMADKADYTMALYTLDCDLGGALESQVKKMPSIFTAY